MVEALTAGDPRWLGPYRITARLGAGGMGQVYLGCSPGGRAVAVKVIRPELTDDPGFRARFAREAAAAQAVSGAFTAAVVGADPHSVPPWLATLYVPGLSLAEAVARHGPLPARSVWALGAGLAEALQAIHAAGLIHRDLKPSNVLLAADGPRVIDFGIAVASEAAGTLTRSGLVVGTPGFMAPEQLTGEPVGTATDVFCLGAVLVFAACGRGPFGQGTTPALGYRAVHEPPDLTDVPEEVRPVVDRCLAKAPPARPTVPELLRELAERVVPEAASQAPGGGAETVVLALRGAHWLPTPVADAVDRAHTRAAAGAPGAPPDSRVDRAATGFGAAPLAGGPAGPGGGAGTPYGPTASGPVPPAVRKGAPPRDGVDPAAPPPGEASDAGAGGRAATRRRVLAALVGTVVAAAAGLGARRLWGAGEGDGADTAGRDSGEPRRPPGRVAWRFTTGGAVTAAMVAAGGVVYASSKDGSLYALDAASGDIRWQFTTGNGVYSSATVTGGVVYIGSADYALYAVNAATGKEKWRLDTDGEVNSSPVVAGGVVYVGSDDRHLYAIDARTGKRRWRFPTGAWVRSSPVVAGGVVYVGCRDRSLYAVDARTGEQRWRFRTGAAVKSSPAMWGRVVCVGSYDGSLYALDADTGEVRWRFRTGAGVGSSPAVAGGAVHVGSDDGHLYAVDIASGERRWAYDVGHIVYSSPAVAGGVVYVGAKSGSLYAVDADTGERRWRFATGADVKSSPAVAGGLVFIGNDDGVVHALRA
ncbi:PQQ-binding-like beta-propeller repeat protein [Streptomyces sp. LX-29]|uniref:serine/threonine-protein kinase n=1 Tax=Streptomyces sp. LX-29 TaxID=2900152 RepID=UPI00240DE883|nr:serine/threonine-protein kinase [Streptomyces sp. LX-29]WFB10786.1 PQQ-binding-like beta-propeller repeat protein [Streptomyces sp. LX-29]